MILLIIFHSHDAEVDYFFTGTTWGEEGYFRLVRGGKPGYDCGILNDVSYPNVYGVPNEYYYADNDDTEEFNDWGETIL